MKLSISGVVLFSILYFLFFINPASADVLTSTNFKVLEPVINNPGGFLSSTSFRLFGSVGEPALGDGEATSFKLRPGFLNFPAPAEEAAPTPSPAPSDPGGGGFIATAIDVITDIIDFIFPPPKPKPRPPIISRADLNKDGYVDILDVGILFHWWDQSIADSQIASLLASVLSTHDQRNPDINQDEMVDIFDLSIMLSEWHPRTLNGNNGGS